MRTNLLKEIKSAEEFRQLLLDSGLTEEILRDIEDGKLVRCKRCGSLLYRASGEVVTGNPKVSWECEDDSNQRSNTECVSDLERRSDI